MARNQRSQGYSRGIGASGSFLPPFTTPRPPLALADGACVGNFRITTLAGSGAHNAVYQAIDETDGAIVAVKVWDGGPFRHDEVAKPVGNDLAGWIALRPHENVRRILRCERIGRHGRQLMAVAMEWIDGVPLAALSDGSV